MKVRTSVSLDPKTDEYLENETDNKSAFINDLIEEHRQETER